MAAAIVVAAVLFVVLRDGGSSGSATTTNNIETERATQVIKIEAGKPAGGPKTLSYTKGERVVFTVVPDSTVEEVHVHGYDIAKETDGTKPVKFSFDADLEGSYEIEAHEMSGAGVLIATLEVRSG